MADSNIGASLFHCLRDRFGGLSSSPPYPCKIWRGSCMDTCVHTKCCGYLEISATKLRCNRRAVAHPRNRLQGGPGPSYWACVSLPQCGKVSLQHLFPSRHEGCSALYQHFRGASLSVVCSPTADAGARWRLQLEASIGHKVLTKQVPV